MMSGFRRSMSNAKGKTMVDYTQYDTLPIKWAGYGTSYELGKRNGYLDAKYLEHRSIIALTSPDSEYAHGYAFGQRWYSEHG